MLIYSSLYNLNDRLHLNQFKHSLIVCIKVKQIVFTNATITQVKNLMIKPLIKLLNNQNELRFLSILMHASSINCIKLSVIIYLYFFSSNSISDKC